MIDLLLLRKVSNVLLELMVFLSQANVIIVKVVIVESKLINLLLIKQTLFFHLLPLANQVFMLGDLLHLNNF